MVVVVVLVLDGAEVEPLEDEDESFSSFST